MAVSRPHPPGWVGSGRWLGDTAFRAILADHLAPGDIDRVLSLLDSTPAGDGGSPGE